MLENYLPILIFLGFGIALSCTIVLFGFILSTKRSNKEKTSPYECGFEPFENARMPFDVRFYLVAILFIIFDLETAFLFPWAVVAKQIGAFGLVSMGVFLGLLIIGFIFEWKKGALEWE